MDYYTTSKAAKILGVSPKRVSIFIREGRLIAEKVRGAWRISAADLHEFARRPRLKPWGKRHLKKNLVME
jgi:excisionase family DNA binding protein